MEVSPFLSVSSFYFTPIFLLAFLLIQTCPNICAVNLIPFFLFSPFICRYASIDYSTIEGPRPIVCAD